MLMQKKRKHCRRKEKKIKERNERFHKCSLVHPKKKKATWTGFSEEKGGLLLFL